MAPAVDVPASNRFFTMMLQTPQPRHASPFQLRCASDAIQNPQSKIKNQRRSPAFTLVELLVAISVLSLMMTLAARIFFDAQTGVQRGLQTSQIIAESRSIAQPMAEDIRAMNVFLSKYESNSPGWLLIRQDAYAGVRFPPPDDINADPSTWLPDRDGDSTPGENGPLPASIDDLMRSDQIAFFRDATDLESLTPGRDDRYDSQAKARHARIWYGHVSPALGPSASLNPGDPGYNLSSQLVLGRQALLLIENSESTTYPGGNPGNVDTPGDANNRVAPSGAFDRASPSSAVIGRQIHEGFYDALDLEAMRIDGSQYSVYDDQGIDPAGGPRGLFRTPTYSVTPAVADASLFGSITAVTGGLPNADYAERAIDWTFTTPGERLQASTSVDNDFPTAGGIFEADTLAQLHAAFAPHVADFAIEFAADWSDDWDDTTTPGTRAAGPDGFPDNEPDRDALGNIVWYTAAAYANPDSASGLINDPPANYDGVGNVDASAPVTYPIPTMVPEFLGAAGFIANPFAYDFTNGPTFAYTPTSTSVSYIWSHTGDDNGLVTASTDGCGKYWPYLIRFRYRLMDGKGEFRSIETNPVTGNDFSVVGRWFEQVVPVPRPQGLY